MIPCDQPTEAAPDVLRRHLLERWSAGRADPVPSRVGEVAAAVAAYCALDLEQQALSDRHLTLLFARALCRAGEAEAAARVMGDEAADPEQAAACLAALDHLATPWPVVDWLARRVCRPSAYTAFEAGACWTLDWSRVQPPPGPPLEVAYAALLDRLVSGVAPLWDATQGQGTLVHAGLARHLARSLGVRRATCLRWTRDLVERTELLLAREAVRRAWLHTPDCRLLDSAY